MPEQIGRQAIVFPCNDTSLVGVADIPSHPQATALLVVTGGPQYRVGSHRQFALLCRTAAQAGFAAMTFDFGGSGDSTGPRRHFEKLDADIRSAIDTLLLTVPQARQVVLLGLCDGASATMMYAASDPRVAGLVLLNPWVRGSGTLEQARVVSYYPSRLTSVSFWKKLFTGKVKLGNSLRSYFANRRAAARAGKAVPDYVQRMQTGLEGFTGPVLLVLSGNDMTASEFSELLATSAAWRKRFARPDCALHEIESANHTFSRAQWRDEVAGRTVTFLQQLRAGSDQ